MICRDHAIALHDCHYNYIRKHQALKTTIAVAVGTANRAFKVRERAQRIDEEKNAARRAIDPLTANNRVRF